MNFYNRDSKGRFERDWVRLALKISLAVLAGILVAASVVGLILWFSNL